MNLVQLDKIFNIRYGNQFDLNKMELGSEDGINFVSRSSQNLGVVAKVLRYKDIEPFEDGLITVTLGGSYLLSSFIQQSPFYTAQNVKVLTPKTKMSFAMKLYYCKAIEANRYRYTTHGREANSTLDRLLVPTIEEAQKVLSKNQTPEVNDKPIKKKREELNLSNWKWFKYDELFDIERGKGPRKMDLDGSGSTPVVTSSDANNGWTDFTDFVATHLGNTIAVNRNGSVGEAFYQPIPFCSTEDVHIFKPKFNFNLYIAIFLITLIKKEKYRYNYGRKWGIERMKASKIKLPVKGDGNPDWDFMENYIKTLPYSSAI